MKTSWHCRDCDTIINGYGSNKAKQNDDLMRKIDQHPCKAAKEKFLDMAANYIAAFALRNGRND